MFERVTNSYFFLISVNYFIINRHHQQPSRFAIKLKLYQPNHSPHSSPIQLIIPSFNRELMSSSTHHSFYTLLYIWCDHIMCVNYSNSVIHITVQLDYQSVIIIYRWLTRRNLIVLVIRGTLVWWNNLLNCWDPPDHNRRDYCTVLQ